MPIQQLTWNGGAVSACASAASVADGKRLTTPAIVLAMTVAARIVRLIVFFPEIDT
jgi:hypothetical protein